MKSKKRHQSSSEDTEESDVTKKSDSSSGSDSEDSSVTEHRYKKKRKFDEFSMSDSDSDDHKRVKKRKHKKKKKKHAKKKRRSDSVEGSDSGEVNSSVSEGEISSRKKRKHKHKHKHTKHANSSSGSDIEEVHVERKLHSVVKERRDSSGEDSQPSRTYYQKQFRNSPSGDDYDREREVQRFYRGSSKEPRQQYQEQYQYTREQNERYPSYRQEKYEKNRDKYGQNSQYNDPREEYIHRQRDYVDYKRHQRYEDRRPTEEDYQRRQPRDDHYHPREDTRNYTRYNQYEEKVPKRREFDDGRDYRERRGPPEPERYREREYAEKKEIYHGPSSDRVREVRDRPRKLDKHPPPMEHREPSRSKSLERYRDKRPDVREGRYREGHGDERRDRPRMSQEHRDDRERPIVKMELQTRERKSRFDHVADNKEYSWGKVDVKKESGKGKEEKEKPNFGLSGKLAADTNTVNGVVIKYSEPDDAKQPKRRWRFYPFKGDKSLPILYIHRQSCFLIGRDKKVVDIGLEHPSISKQHAVLQYRATPFTRPDGSQGRRVRPYLIDLESANGTFVNNKKIEPRRYVELLERDVVKFGFSLREYVLLHENSKDDAQDDDHQEPSDIGGNVTTTQQMKEEKRAKQVAEADGD